MRKQPQMSPTRQSRYVDGANADERRPQRRRKCVHRPARSLCTYCGRPFFHRADSRPQFCGTGCARLAYLDGERGEGEAPLRGGNLPREAAPDPFTRRLADGFALLQGENE